MFTFLIFLSAFLLEGIGTYVSVIGLGHLFAYSMVVMIMAVALDVAKVATVTFLYRHWQEIGLTMKSYMLAATFVLMIITSTGVFGYLSGEFQKAISGNTQQTVVIQSLVDEQVRLQKRKEEIDKQIAQLPQNNVRGRRQLMQQFAPEVERLNTRLVEIDVKLPELKVANIEKETHVGPIMYVAQAFDTSPEKAVKWIIFTIIGVFDPLAIALLVGGNFLLERNKKKDEVKPVLEEFVPEKHGGEFPEAVPVPIFSEFPQWEMTETIATPTPEPKQKRKYIRKVKPIPVVEPIPEREKVVIKQTEKKVPPPKVVVANEGDKEVIKIEKQLMPTSLDKVRPGDGVINEATQSSASRQYSQD